MNYVKGELHGKCNRSICDIKGDNVKYFNHYTLKHYCYRCAFKINEANKRDAMKMFGHDLCTLVDTNANRHKI